MGGCAREKKTELYLHNGVYETDHPRVKYRGIFINDEAPALSSWSREKFGGFNHHFYEKVFELMLRLKANYLWPAMWGSAFYDDDSLNIRAAEDYAIVIGTSHHEPLMRAHDEWRRYGKGQKWNYDSTKEGLSNFWREGMIRAKNEKIVSVGMRGDGDEPMSRETATGLLERIVADQRKIIEQTTGKPATETPQLWALYKEVQDYYDKGMRVPEDITLLLCDDNWGNLRKLPKPGTPGRKGGYGIYYHFDYVGGPRNYKWINTNPLPRIWEQMNLAWQHKVDRIWIVNVGDIKPMELPISFFIDFAWNPNNIGPAEINKYTEDWSREQFGAPFAKEAAVILALYGKYAGRRKPELLDPSTFSFNYNEWHRVVADFRKLRDRANAQYARLPAETKDAYFQLVAHPVRAMANLYALYYNTALNRAAADSGNRIANYFAQQAKGNFEMDSIITADYHTLRGGKWNHMMSQTHIGYSSWQQPEVQRMPPLRYVTSGADSSITDFIYRAPAKPKARAVTHTVKDGYISMHADAFSKMVGKHDIKWVVLPDHGRTGNALTTVPYTASYQGQAGPVAEYSIELKTPGELRVHCYFSPTLNFYGDDSGLEYAISIDGEQPQVISLNKEDKNSISGIWNKWVAENIIIKTSIHKVEKAGKHTIKYGMRSPGVVLQKIVVDAGGLKPSYLGPE